MVVVSVAVYIAVMGYQTSKNNKHRTVAKMPTFDKSPCCIIAYNQPPQILYLQMWWFYCNLHQVVVVTAFRPSYSCMQSGEESSPSGHFNPEGHNVQDGELSSTDCIS